MASSDRRRLIPKDINNTWNIGDRENLDTPAGVGFISIRSLLIHVVIVMVMVLHHSPFMRSRRDGSPLQNPTLLVFLYQCPRWPSCHSSPQHRSSASGHDDPGTNVALPGTFVILPSAWPLDREPTPCQSRDGRARVTISPYFLSQLVF